MLRNMQIAQQPLLYIAERNLHVTNQFFTTEKSEDFAFINVIDFTTYGNKSFKFTCYIIISPSKLAPF